jgi:ribosomal protein S28E/S33
LLRIFERKILRKIYGPVQEGDTSIWRIRNNGELKGSINREDIVKFIKSQRIK